VIPLVSGLGLGLAMATDTPNAEVYPAKQIVAWEDGAVIERPFASKSNRFAPKGDRFDGQRRVEPDPVDRDFQSPDHPYTVLTGLRLPDLRQPSRWDAANIKRNILVYRSNTNHVTLLCSWYKQFPNQKPIISVKQSSLPFPTEDPANARIIWFLKHVDCMDSYKSMMEDLSIPTSCYSDVLRKDSLKKEFDYTPPQGCLENEAIAILNSSVKYLTKNVFDYFSRDIEIHISRFLVEEPAGGNKRYLGDYSLTLRATIRIYGHSISFSLRRSINREWIVDKNPIDVLLEGGFIESAEQHEERIQNMLKIGAPNYMDGYESMATLIDKHQSIARIPEEEFSELFGALP
jgi:hypothetical protein